MGEIFFTVVIGLIGISATVIFINFALSYPEVVIGIPLLLFFAYGVGIIVQALLGL